MINNSKYTLVVSPEGLIFGEVNQVEDILSSLV
jgi:hypothetical protein